MSEQENKRVDQEQPAEQVKPQKADKAGKPAKKKDKPGLGARISRWFREMKSELKKVQWPTWKQTLNNTIIVIVCVILVGIFIWVFDWLARLIVQALLDLAGKV